MGNGANSRPENPVVMQRRGPPSNALTTSQQPGYGFTGYVANGGNAYDQRFQPQYGAQSHYSDSSGLRNGWGTQHSDPYGSSSSDYGYYATHGPSVAPHSTSYSRSHPRKDRHGKNRQDFSHQSALSTHPHSKRAKPNGQAGNYGNQRGYSNWDQQNTSSHSDEILFEVFHCVQTGRDYNVINVDGVRYLVNSWDAGIALLVFLRGGVGRVG